MKQGKSIVELAAELERQNTAKADYLVDTPELYMAPDGHRIQIPDDEFSIGRTAHRQIGERLKIPAAYYDRLQGLYPSLLADNVNYLFRKEPEKRMLRTLDGQARAFLSDRYRRIDNHEIAGVALPILLDSPEIRVISSEITERRMYISVVFPRVAGEVKVGDEVQAGLTITNSEIGLGSFAVSPLIYRLVCSNGMITQHAMKKYHVGRRAETFEGSYEVFSDETVAADDRALMLKVRDVVKASMDQARFNDELLRLRGATTAETELTGDPVKAVEKLAGKVRLSNAESSAVLRNLIKDGDLTKYGMAQAVTAVANTDVVDYDRAVELQQIGSRIIDLSPSQYREVREAA